MKITKYIALVLICMPYFGFAQIEYECQIVSEKETDEQFFSDQTIFGDGDSKKYQNRVISQKNENEKYTVLVGSKSFEEGNPFCNPRMYGDTLKIEFRVKGEIGSDGIESVGFGQSKYRELQITISNITLRPNVVLLNGDEIVETQEEFITIPIKYEIQKGDTVNRIDKFGQKQGKWIEGTKYNITESYYKDSKIEKGMMLDYSYAGQLKSEYFYFLDDKEGRVYHRSYFNTGTVKEENYEIRDNGKFKTKWYENGNVFQENIFNGELIEIVQYKENGKVNCKCETEVGVEVFEGKVICWNKNEFMIPCKFFNEKGQEIRNEEKIFRLNFEIKPR